VPGLDEQLKAFLMPTLLDHTCSGRLLGSNGLLGHPQGKEMAGKTSKFKVRCDPAIAGT